MLHIYCLTFSSITWNSQPPFVLFKTSLCVLQSKCLNALTWQLFEVLLENISFSLVIKTTIEAYLKSFCRSIKIDGLNTITSFLIFFLKTTCNKWPKFLIFYALIYWKSSLDSKLCTQTAYSITWLWMDEM